MSETLDTMCRRLLLAARSPGDKVYQAVGFQGRSYAAFNLVLDSDDHILVVAYCWAGQALHQIREDLLDFASAAPIAGVRKKLQLILIYDEAVRLEDQMWPAGISLSPIALPEGIREDHVPPAWVEQKLGRVMGWTDRKTAASRMHPAAWPHFITVDHVLKRVDQLKAADDILPEEKAMIVRDLLALVTEPDGNLYQRVVECLNERWKEYS